MAWVLRRRLLYFSKVSTFTMHDIQLLKISAGMAAVDLMSFAIFIRCSWKWGNDMQSQELAEQLLLFWSLWTHELHQLPATLEFRYLDTPRVACAGENSSAGREQR